MAISQPDVSSYCALLTGNGNRVTWRNSGGSPAGYGEDFAGNLYLADYGGTIFRLEATDPVVFANGMEPE